MANNDLLIKLYDMNSHPLSLNENNQEITIRKPIGTDRRMLINWAQKHFPDVWLSEIESALVNTPCSCFIAQQDNSLLGFVCYDSTALGYFGPIGVVKEARGNGIGLTLAKHCLQDMWLKGYGYAIVGMANSPAFYQKIAPVIEIPDSDPGIYRMTNALRKS
ncbi:MAG: GNAT family N-acetyltransferase [Candidatus Thiodiazotropha sp. LLP2]